MSPYREPGRREPKSVPPSSTPAMALLLLVVMIFLGVLARKSTERGASPVVTSNAFMHVGE